MVDIDEMGRSADMRPLVDLNRILHVSHPHRVDIDVQPRTHHLNARFKGAMEIPGGHRIARGIDIHVQDLRVYFPHLPLRLEPDRGRVPFLVPFRYILSGKVRRTNLEVTDCAGIVTDLERRRVREALFRNDGRIGAVAREGLTWMRGLDRGLPTSR